MKWLLENQKEVDALEYIGKSPYWCSGSRHSHNEKLIARVGRCQSIDLDEFKKKEAEYLNEKRLEDLGESVRWENLSYSFFTVSDEARTFMILMNPITASKTYPKFYVVQVMPGIVVRTTDNIVSVARFHEKNFKGWANLPKMSNPGSVIVEAIRRLTYAIFKERGIDVFRAWQVAGDIEE